MLVTIAGLAGRAVSIAFESKTSGLSYQYISKHKTENNKKFGKWQNADTPKMKTMILKNHFKNAMFYSK
jgi:hypothetical protein